ncbi:spermidine synthase 1-like [Prunus avium]|uniref:Spermidine synthase 1-like n=1 Tax=Prunus avium TaxID=42229 RepID=A0A6P5TF96_PRUAV|nr:spermidine synthase 1-like [Prunus avium]
MMFQVYKRFVPEVAVGYEDPRVQVHISNGVEFMKNVPQGTYDAIMLDAFQNMGTTSTELTDIFLESVARALRPGDVMSTPADSF